EGRVIGRNLSSMAVYHGLGFTPEGVLRKHAPGLEGGRTDVYLFGLLKREWEGAPERGRREP
ncbi:MAG TPA: GNAT family protein, partial [Sphingomonadales bacterium]|nr:GNAT family protein [Sphingomonadales bacterium]